MLPPCRSMICLVMYKPSPVPLTFLVSGLSSRENFWNSLPVCSSRHGRGIVIDIDLDLAVESAGR